MSNQKQKIELLAPAGNYEAFIQAINNGANAVYLAGKNFNARSFANNFTIDEIAQMVKYAHIRDVKIYVTVNTLIKDTEIMDALKFIESLYKANVDAILMQDIGLINIVHKAFPDLEIHASTQMNCTTVQDAQRLKALGMKRIVLAREVDLETIQKIKENVDIELEVFCHGALCMSYSGNCLMSSLIGGRSGNRGKCAQSCRQEYELEVQTESAIEVIDKKYYLSCKDLMTLDHINELKNVGIDSLKIEGRGKEAEYVATVVKWYRNALDNGVTKETVEKGIKQLKLVYNRQFTRGYLFGEKNKDFTNINAVNHLGLPIGTVTRSDKQNVYIQLTEDLAIDDCIRIVNDKDETKDAIIVNNMYRADQYSKENGLIKQANKGMLVKMHCHNEELKPGYLVLKTKDNKIVTNAQNTPEKKVLVSGVLYVKNNHLALDLTHGRIKASAISNIEVQEAKNKDMKDRIIEQVNKINDTCYEFENLKYLGEAVFLPIKEINELRRNALQELENKIIESFKVDYHYNKFKTQAKEYQNEKRLYAKVTSKAQANACIDAGIHYILSEKKELIEELKQSKDSSIHFIYLEPRLSENNPGFAIDEINHETITSVYQNVMNIFAVNFYHEQEVNIVGISPELSKKEIVEIVNRYQNTFKKKPNLLMMVYGRYEMMLMKHCPINKALGYSNKGCLECERKQYYLKDKKDYEFPLVRTINCNMKLLNSRTTSLIDYLKEIIHIGIYNLLLDFTLEDYEETLRVCMNYKECFDEEKNGIEENPYTTHGAYENGIE